MTRELKGALARIYSDLIKADVIVDRKEMEMWDTLRLSDTALSDARSVSLADAVRAVREAGPADDVLDRCRQIALSDGYCAPSEALLLLALQYALERGADIVSVPATDFNIAPGTTLYVENRPMGDINAAIRDNYRNIANELALAGFSFCYIPRIIEAYRQADPEFLHRFLAFLAPAVSDDKICDRQRRLLELTTAEFCRNILCNKCGMTDMRDTPPSLLIKVGESLMADGRMANYLRVGVTADVVDEVRRLTDAFSAMSVATPVAVPTLNPDSLRYDGFYKQLLDFFLVQVHTRSDVEIVTSNGTVCLKDLDSAKLDAPVSRRERVFYTLLLCVGEDGIDISAPASAADFKRCQARLDRLQAVYDRIYEAFGGEREQAPQLTNINAVREMRSRINKRLGEFKALLNPEEYKVSNVDGRMRVLLPREMVWVKPTKSGDPVRLTDSPFYKKVMTGKEG